MTRYGILTIFPPISFIFFAIFDLIQPILIKSGSLNFTRGSDSWFQSVQIELKSGKGSSWLEQTRTEPIRALVVTIPIPTRGTEKKIPWIIAPEFEKIWYAMASWPLLINVWNRYKSYCTHGTVENKIESFSSRFSIFYDSMSSNCDLYHAPSFN